MLSFKIRQNALNIQFSIPACQGNIEEQPVDVKGLVVLPLGEFFKIFRQDAKKDRDTLAPLREVIFSQPLSAQLLLRYHAQTRFDLAKSGEMGYRATLFHLIAKIIVEGIYQV